MLLTLWLRRLRFDGETKRQFLPAISTRREHDEADTTSALTYRAQLIRGHSNVPGFNQYGDTASRP